MLEMDSSFPEIKPPRSPQAAPNRGDAETGHPRDQVCVVGMWHLGTVAAACLAELGHRVVGVDRDPRRVADLERGVPPLFEPGLGDLITRNHAGGRLDFTTNLPVAVKGSAFVWIAFDTPVDDKDESDLSPLWDAVRELAPALGEDATVLVSSQVPVGTCEQFWATIQEINPAARGGIVYIPENLRLGPAIDRFQHPDMVVFGTNDATAGNRAAQLLRLVEAPKLQVGLRTGEMVKHAINTFLATSVSLANELGNLCDLVGADGLAVAQAMRLDSRIGAQARVDPGLGFAGGTLARDLKTLQRVARSRGGHSTLIDAVLEVNRRQNRWVFERLAELVALHGAIIGILGLTYTPNTSTLRRSAAIELIGDLRAAGATVKAYDPKADPSELGPAPDFEVCADAYATASGSDALVIATDWPEFKALDFGRVRSTMRRPLLLDAKNLLDAAALLRLGFEFLGIGRGHLARFRKRVGR